jgi:hypothetical protein
MGKGIACAVNDVQLRRVPLPFAEPVERFERSITLLAVKRNDDDFSQFDQFVERRNRRQASRERSTVRVSNNATAEISRIGTPAIAKR